MTYPDAVSYLGQARRFGMKLGLDAMRELARSLGDPQKKLRFIHLAGTNGKGSTGAFCEACLRAAGHRVGLYTSPHLVGIRERIQIDRRLISKDDFAEGMTWIRKHAENFQTHEFTFFEILTALALWYFEREKVEWVVWETGLGGRLDATNIVRPEVCIITNIGRDHQQYLGESLKDIAAEKAGIIKPCVPVVSAVESGEAADVIGARAQTECSPLFLVERDMTVKDLGLSENRQRAEIDGHEFVLGLIGPHQIYNAACAFGAMRQLKISRDAVARGLADTVWPGRFEILSEKPLIVLDGAHNPGAVAMLAETWRTFLAARFCRPPRETDGRARLVFASVADRDISEMAQLLRPLIREVSLVRLVNERGAQPERLVSSFAGLPCVCYNSVSSVWEDISASDPDSVTLVTGSLFLVGEMLARRHDNAEEYRLNERLEKLTA